MKKKIIIISATISIILLGLIVGLSINKHNKEKEEKLMQIRNVCELATIKTYYNNVVKYTQPKEPGFEHIGEVNRELWIEYTGTADIGIDMKEVDIKIRGKKIIVYMPKAKVLTIDHEPITEDNYKMTKDSWFNKNKISAKKQISLVDEGQEKMRNTIESDETVINQAQERAKELIANHINKMGQIAKKEYKIEWVIRDI